MTKLELGVKSQRLPDFSKLGDLRELHNEKVSSENQQSQNEILIKSYPIFMFIIGWACWVASLILLLAVGTGLLNGLTSKYWFKYLIIIALAVAGIAILYFARYEMSLFDKKNDLFL